MTEMSAGIWAQFVDYNLTSLCLKDGLSRLNKKQCRNITGMWPSSAGSLMFSQGLPIRPYAINEQSSGIRFQNGTWTGALGLLQSGTVDMWAVDALFTSERNRDFLFTTPYSIERYGALMKRPEVEFAIDIDGMTAGIDRSIYGMLFVLLACLFLTCYINELLRPSAERNSNWHLLLSLFPWNGQMWPNQCGVTRKLLMTTCGFGILLLSSLYQAKFAEYLMIPYDPPKIALKDIEKAVTSHNAKLMFPFVDSPVMNYIMNVSSVLATSIDRVQANVLIQYRIDWRLWRKMCRLHLKWCQL